jgi:hypothetical protein
MNIPVEIIAAILAVVLTFLLSAQIAVRKRLERTEKNLLTVIIMLSQHGLKIPEGDTSHILKKLL